MFPKAHPFGEDTLAQANRLVPTLDGHLCGMEVLAPLREAPAQLPMTKCPRNILLPTDVEVINEAEILALAQQHPGQAAIYPVGLVRS